MNQLIVSPMSFLVTLGVIAIILMVWLITRRGIALQTVRQARELAQHVLNDAEREAESKRKEVLLAAKEEAHNLLRATEDQTRIRQEKISATEKSLEEKTYTLSKRLSTIESTEKDVHVREQKISNREKEVTSQTEKYTILVANQQRELERVAGMTTEEAKQVLINQLESEARMEAAHLIKRLESEARETAAAKAKHVITEAIQRSAAEHAIETTVSVVDLPSDDLKGRIIGREGRNIRALETATGVELIVDDTPGAIILSSFEPYRREVAKQAIERLIADGRIHPARIEEVVSKVRSEVDEATLKEGEAVAFELGIHDMHPDIYRMMGKLKFRTSYGQNVLSHSKEVAYLAGIMAREVGLDAQVSTRAAFLHDIGKAMDRELQGTHLELGIEFLRKHGESSAVVDAMAAHHMDIDWPSLESMIVQAADAISAARPGARRDILESYVKRLEKLEDIADSFKGVSKAFALQAGREIRILVESEQISDEETVWLSKDIAKRVENELDYPGQIKVTVIRETRAIDYAR